MLKVDLHNHTNFSFDGSMNPRQFTQAVREAGLDVVAVTDHGTRLGGLAVRELDPPFRVIIGCEIMTTHGELIGLFLDSLTKDPPRDMDPVDAAKFIHDAGGVTYLPHPFLPYLGSRMRPEVLPRLAPHLDIVEGLNARGSQVAHDRDAMLWARAHDIAVGGGSDAHVASGVGTGFVLMENFDGPTDLLAMLRKGSLVCRAREQTWRSALNLAFGVTLGYRRIRKMKARIDAGEPLRAAWDKTYTGVAG